MAPLTTCGHLSPSLSLGPFFALNANELDLYCMWSTHTREVELAKNSPYIWYRWILKIMNVQANQGYVISSICDWKCLHVRGIFWKEYFHIRTRHSNEFEMSFYFLEFISTSKGYFKRKNIFPIDFPISSILFSVCLISIDAAMYFLHVNARDGYS